MVLWECSVRGLRTEQQNVAIDALAAEILDRKNSAFEEGNHNASKP